MNLLTNNEIAFSNFTDASVVMEILLRNNYVCMLSMEDNLYILNYEWESYCNRNGIVFINRDYYDCHQYDECKKCECSNEMENTYD